MVLSVEWGDAARWLESGENERCVYITNSVRQMSVEWNVNNMGVPEREQARELQALDRAHKTAYPGCSVHFWNCQLVKI